MTVLVRPRPLSWLILALTATGILGQCDFSGLQGRWLRRRIDDVTAEIEQFTGDQWERRNTTGVIATYPCLQWELVSNFHYFLLDPDPGGTASNRCVKIYRQPASPLALYYEESGDFASLDECRISIAGIGTDPLILLKVADTYTGAADPGARSDWRCPDALRPGSFHVTYSTTPGQVNCAADGARSTVIAPTGGGTVQGVTLNTCSGAVPDYGTLYANNSELVCVGRIPFERFISQSDRLIFSYAGTTGLYCATYAMRDAGSQADIRMSLTLRDADGALSCPRNAGPTDAASDNNPRRVALVFQANECVTVADCQNGGTCTQRIGSFTCSCADGFRGTSCQTVTCTAGICQNGATCLEGDAELGCQCVPGYTGSQCQTEVNECDSSPCLNSATCTDQLNRYTCTCPTNYLGDSCEDFNDCVSAPCENGAVCRNTVTSYFCACPTGFTGSACSVEVDECSSNPCRNGGTCTDRVGTYDCQCAAGFTGTNCRTDIDDCVGQQCPNEATCYDGVNEYFCRCPRNRFGANCEIVHDCRNVTCQNAGSCRDDCDALYCQCPPGFAGRFCQNAVGPCFEGGPCRNGAACRADRGLPVCQCRSGYTGPTCEGLSECGGLTCENGGLCERFESQFVCLCPENVSGVRCEKDGGLDGVQIVLIILFAVLSVLAAATCAAVLSRAFC